MPGLPWPRLLAAACCCVALNNNRIINPHSQCTDWDCCLMLMLNKTNNNVFTNWVETRIKSSSIPPYAIWNGYSLLTTYTLFWYSEDFALSTDDTWYCIQLCIHLLFAKNCRLWPLLIVYVKCKVSDKLQIVARCCRSVAPPSVSIAGDIACCWLRTWPLWLC